MPAVLLVRRTKSRTFVLLAIKGFDMSTTIEQIKLEAQAAFLSETMPTHECKPSNFYVDGYLRARTDQATEIAELKAKLAMASSAIQKAYSFQSSGASPSIHDYGRWRRIEATIEQLLKD